MRTPHYLGGPTKKKPTLATSVLVSIAGSPLVRGLDLLKDYDVNLKTDIIEIGLNIIKLDISLVFALAIPNEAVYLTPHVFTHAVTENGHPEDEGTESISAIGPGVDKITIVATLGEVDTGPTGLEVLTHIHNEGVNDLAANPV